MSRGIGKMQSSILAGIDNFGGQILQNQLLWHLAEVHSKIQKDSRIYDDVYEGAIKRTYQTSFLRAVDHLVEIGKIKREDLYINDLAKLFIHYPFKTYRLEISSLRSKLLPVAKAYLAHGYRKFTHVRRSFPRFGTGDHELFVLKNAKHSNADFHSQIKSRWLSIESDILAILASKKVTESNHWIRILFKGRHLFLEEKNLKYTISLNSLLASLMSHKDSMYDLECKVLDKIHKFRYFAFREDDINRAVMKTALYQLANFQIRGPATLHKEVKLFMFDMCPDLIRSLPGHNEPSLNIRGAWIKREVRFSNMLDKLIDRHIFSPFCFISSQ